MLNCLLGYIGLLSRSPGTKGKSRVSYPVHGSLSSGARPSMPPPPPKKNTYTHTNGLMKSNYQLYLLFIYNNHPLKFFSTNILSKITYKAIYNIEHSFSIWLNIDGLLLKWCSHHIFKQCNCNYIFNPSILLNVRLSKKGNCSFHTIKLGFIYL